VLASEIIRERNFDEQLNKTMKLMNFVSSLCWQQKLRQACFIRGVNVARSLAVTGQFADCQIVD